MKKYEQQTKLVRISFGTGNSISFTNTNVNEVYNLFRRVFDDLEVESTIKVKGSPFSVPTTHAGFNVHIREEYNNLPRGKGKSKTKKIYGLTEKQAKEYFEENWQRYLN